MTDLLETIHAVNEVLICIHGFKILQTVNNKIKKELERIEE